MEKKLNKDIIEAIFYSNQKKGFIETTFGKKTEIGLTQMIENDSFSTEEIAKAIFENNESKGKIKTGYGDKTLKGLTEMIEDARPNKYEHGGVVYSKDGYVKSIKDFNGKLIKEMEVNGVTYRYNPVYKTYNSVINNELLHKSKYENGGEIGECTYSIGGL